MTRDPHEAQAGRDAYQAAADLRGVKRDTPVEILGIGTKSNVGFALGGGADLFPGDTATVSARIAAQAIAAGKAQFVRLAK